MKKTVVVLGVMSLAAIFLLGHARVPADGRTDVSMSQIYIHGTPVCVLRQGGDIEARVGACDREAGPEGEDAPGNIPNPGDPGTGMTLPPGHPPIGNGPDFGPDGSRRIQI